MKALFLFAALGGAQLASAGWMGVTTGCDTGPNEWVRYYGQGCAATFWTNYWAQEGEEYVQYPVLVEEEASFRTSGFSTLAVHQRNSPVGIFELAGFGPLNFSSFSAYFLEVIKIYVPGVPGDYWVEVDWGLGRLPYTAEFAFWQVSRLDGNELLRVPYST